MGFEQVAIEDPLADVRWARPGTAGEQRAAVEDDRRATALLGRGGIAHLADQVHQEQHRPVGDGWEACAEPAGEAAVVVLFEYFGLFFLPVHTERRVRQAVVVGVAGVAVVEEGVAELDGVHRLALHHHVGLADRVRLRVNLLPCQVEGGRQVQFSDAVFASRQHPARSGRRVIDRPHDVRLGEGVGIRCQQ